MQSKGKIFEINRLGCCLSGGSCVLNLASHASVRFPLAGRGVILCCLRSKAVGAGIKGCSA